MDKTLKVIQERWSKINPNERMFIPTKFGEKKDWEIVQIVDDVNKRGLQITFNQKFQSNQKFPEFNILKIYSHTTSKTTDIFLILSDQQYNEHFDHLITHIVRSINSKNSPKEALQQLNKTLIMWKYLLSTSPQKSLNDSIGLFGELWFLKNILSKNIKFDHAVDAWTSKFGSQDFNGESWSFEIKTTKKLNPTKISISSESQLDSKNDHPIFLGFLSLNENKPFEETLNNLVKTCRDKCSTSTALSILDEKLLEYGYALYEPEAYSEIGFSVIYFKIFEVSSEFPKIIESDLCFGVNDVKYKINLSECLKFEKQITDIWSKKNEN